MLLKARESISQVAQKAVKSLDDVTKAQRRVTEESNRATAPLREQISTLQKLVDAHVREKKALEDSSKALRGTATARREAANASRKQLEELQRQARLERANATEREKRDIEEVRRIRLEIAERVASTEKKTKAFNQETKELRQQASLLHALNQESAAANQRRAAELGVQIAQIQQDAREKSRAAVASEQAAGREERAFNRVSSSVDRHNKTLERARESLAKTEGSFGRAERSTGPFMRALERMGVSSNNARSGLKGLNAEFQGFQLALIIKYAQSLVSALIALGAQLVAVAAAAGQAAIGLGAALAAGAAESIPVIGVLIAAFSRLTTVLKAVKLFNQQQLTATHDATRSAKAQTAATDQIRSAEQRVADAHRNTARAVSDLSRTRSDAAREERQSQEEVTKARKDAIRTVEDLKAAEEDAARSLDDARVKRQQAIESGDVGATVAADVDVSRARRDLRRARQDVAPVRARGVEGVEAVQQAEQRLADTRRQGARQIQQAEQRLGDARRSEVQATQDLTRTRREAADNLAQETAAVDKLADSLKQLSPAERDLYRRILVLQETYKRIARPITDIITRAFTDVVNRVNALLSDPRIARGFRNIATQVAQSIRQVTGEAGGQRSVGAFQILSAEAVRNIPIATRILINFFDAVRNLVLDAVPAFRLLLRYVEGYSQKAKEASGNSKGISDFFLAGVRYANSFFKLALAVVRLLLTIAGRGGAAGEGIRTINDLTDAVDGLTDKARKNAGAIRRFFHNTHDAFFEILGVLGTLAKAIVSTFSPSSVKSFADFLNRVIIPALANTVQVMGALVTVFHQVFSLPGVSQVAQVAATALLLAKGMTIIRKAIFSITEIIPDFLRAMGLMTVAEEGAAAGAATGFAALTPAGWVVVGILAVVAAIVLLDKKLHFLGPTWRWIKNAAVDAWDGIKSAAEAVVSWFSDVWTQGLLYWLRYPFVWFARHVSFPVFKLIINAAADLIGWFKDHFGGGGFWGALSDVLMLPFRTTWAGIKLIFKLIKTAIIVLLDVIAGRFGDAGDTLKNFWADLLDTMEGAVTSLLGILQKLYSALGSIPKIGGPFKDAAADIKRARKEIDDYRESTRNHRKEQEKANDALKDAAPALVTLRNRYDDATDRVHKLTPGTDAYKDAVVRARRAHKDYNDKLQETADKSKNAQGPVRRLRGNISNLGGTAADVADVIAKNLNDVLRQVGARTIRLNTRAYRRSGIDQMTEVTGHGATGGVLSRSSGLRRRMWGGGVPNPYGGAGDDHLLLSPSGMPVAALSGTEGIVNTPQMGVINSALDFTRQMTGMPWGSLNDLWGSGMRHFQGGGGLQPAISTLSNRLDRMFGLTTTSGYRTSMPLGHPDYHNVGLAADVSGTPTAMARAVHYIKTSGIVRSLLEGIHQPGLSVKNGRSVAPSFWGANTWNDHVDHIHLALRALSARLADGLGRVRTPQIRGLGNDALSRIARGGARMLTQAANRYLQRQQARLGGADPKAMGADANVIAAFRRAIHVSGANRKEQLGLWESGIVESGLKNLHFGDADSLGALQERTSIYGRAHALNPFASAMRFLRAAIGLRPWRGSAGMLAAAVQRPAAQLRGRYDQVSQRAARYLQGGGLLGTSRITGAGLNTPRRRTAVSPIVDRINNLLGDVVSVLDVVARGPLRRSKNLVGRIKNAFERITGDNGLLDQMRAATESIVGRAARRLQQRQFHVGAGGPVRLAFTDAQVAQGELLGLQAQRTGLTAERSGIRDSIDDAQSALAVARRRHNKRAAAAARAALINLRTRLDANATALAQNSQDQVEAQERFQDALLAAVNDVATRQSSAIDRWSRMAKALGQNLDPNAVLGAQVKNMQDQIGGLQGVLAQAQQTGNTTLANTISDQIAELNVSIAESVAQQFQNSIDAVNTAAQKQNTRLDRATRLAQLGGQTNFGALGGILKQRSVVLTQQRAGLLSLLGQAQSQGNVEQVDNLVDQIDELNVQMAENTQAVQDNTDAGFNFVTQQINDAATFSQGVFGGAQSFFQALSEATGMDTSAQQLSVLQGIATTLSTQSGGLQQQLAKLIGDNSVLGLSGQDLVNYLLSITSGPAYQAILASLDPTQEQSFQDLITALLGNATATVQNTDALNDLAHPGAQSFSSTLWQTFRNAVFTGAGDLLSQYQTTIPTAAVGAHVLASGMMLVHAGENVRPASVSRDWQGGGGDTYELNVTTPTEVLNPTDVGRQLAFYRKSQGR